MNRSRTWLRTLGLLCVLCGTSAAQEGWEQEDVYVPRPELETDYFAPPDFSTFGSGPKPPTGMYLNLDYLNMMLESPDVGPIGFPNDTRSISTAGFENEWTDGSRIEMGVRDQEGHGWLIGGFSTTSSNDTYVSTGEFISNVLVADEVDADVENKTDFYGLEVLRTWRKKPARRPNAAIFEFMMGLRYINLSDKYNVDMYENNHGFLVDDAGEIIEEFEYHDDANINGKSTNSLFGPEIGYRWSKAKGPWSFASEGRFFAAWNYQSLRLRQNYNDNFPDNVLDLTGGTAAIRGFGGIGVDEFGAEHSVHSDTFAPMAEIRFEVAYQLTRRMKARMGYTGMYVANLARISSMLDFTDPDVPATISFLRSEQDVWAHALHMGVEFNH